MKIRKQLFYNIFILIIYYALFLASVIIPSSDDDKNPIYTATFVLLISLYLLLVKNKKNIFYYTILVIVIPTIFIFSVVSTDIYMETSFFNNIHWTSYIYGYILFFISYFFLLKAINKIVEKSSTDDIIIIKGKDYVSVSIIVLIGISTILFSINQCNRISNRYERIKEYESMVADTTVVVVPVDEGNPIDYGDYEESDEGDNEEVINTYSLASLWDNPAEDENIIQDLITYCIGNKLPIDGNGSLQAILYDTYCYFSQSSNEDNQRILDYVDQEERPYLSNAIKIKDKINRDPQKIKSLFYTYKHILYKSLPNKIYHKTDLGNLVDILILSYKDIYNNNDSENLILTIRENAFIKDTIAMNSGFLVFPMENVISEDYKREYRNIYFGNGAKVRDEDLFWAYTFWARRDLENNVKEVYEILKEIQNHYAE